METSEIRRRWLTFFEGKGHTVVPSAPLPFDDPNLLFVNAGMVPFVPYFLGQQTPPYSRATSVQKCVRTGDIDEVGKTSRHGTFFQMNGNFSFGDYFKAEAISFAWELLTSSQADGGYGLDAERLWPTVYQDDDEAYSVWHDTIGVPAERITRLGKADNYWSMGIPGPCGPDSEIFYDRGPEYGREGGPAVDDDRYLELWNLVFMQEERGEGYGKDDFEILGELPTKNIDTGMGLERMAAVLQGVDNLYEIDQVRPVLDRAAEMAGKTYAATGGKVASESSPDDVRLRVVADHVRTSLMLIGDGVTPGNEGRGYVLRRLLRRAVRAMRLLGVDEPCLPELLPVSRDRMATSYPELSREWERISSVAYAEEDAFRRTLSAGTTILDAAVSRTREAGGKELPGAQAFQLHDTYGFPIDLTLEMAAEQGLSVDEKGFRELMAAQRDRAKADARAKKQGHGGSTVYRQIGDALGRAVEFTGYDETTSQGSVAALVKDGATADSAGVGDEIDLVLDRTPFYAESGGQLADHGRIELDNGAVLDVTDVQSPISGVVVHRAKVVSGDVRSGLSANAVVDPIRRAAVSRAHTATHMVHKALREALGETATQAGSENAPGRLRFDFRSQVAPDAATLQAIEARVNQRLLEDLEVTSQLMSHDDAIASGAMALFGQKYGDVVRVVSVGGDWSRELCGGTHIPSSSKLGLFTLVGEQSIGSGVRRIEALVADQAYDFLSKEHVLVNQLTDTLKARPDELHGRVEQLVARLRDAERELASLRQQQVLANAGRLLDEAQDVGGVRLLAKDIGEGVSADDLRSLAGDLRQRLGSVPGVVALIGQANGRPVLVVATTGEARDRGLRAGDLVKKGAGVLGGGGGGKPDMAQGGGQDVTKIDDAFRAIRSLVEESA